MAKMREAELRALLAAEHLSALGSMQASQLVAERSDAMDYYLGNMAKDTPAQDGRSRAVSFDVADTIEGLMPSLMEVFCGSEEVVQFDPVGQDDVEPAQQETDYINHVFMNQNPGFLVLYSFVKDALLSKVGIVKVWWETKEQEQQETYTDQPDDAYALIVSSPDIEVTAHSERDDEYNPGQKLHDVTVVTKKDYSCAKVLGVPPEEFGIERGARSLRDCNYCYHKVISTESKLIEQGYDPEQVHNLPSYRAYSNVEEISRDTVSENQLYGDETNKAARLVEIIEHYCRMDYQGDGKARLYRVTTSGITGEVLDKTSDEAKKYGAALKRADGTLDITEVDAFPFAAMTPVIVTHRFWGRSIADLVMDIQRIKTALTRGMLDNIYLALNPRVEVAESHASENTLDDLLVSRPGGIVRTKIPGGLTWQQVPDVTPAVAPALQYYDTLREWRTGVSRVGQGIDANALNNQSATAAAQMYSAAQARMKLIARIFAETGVKDLFWLLHGTIRKHGQQAQTVRLRNTWVTVDPRNWKTRNDLTVTVGLGTGSKAQQLQEIQLIIGAQEKAISGGLTNLVTVDNLYNSAKQLTKIVGHKDVDAFFTNPKTQPPPQPKQDHKIQEIQAQAETDQQQMQLEAQIKEREMRMTAVAEERRFQLEATLKEREAQLKEREMVFAHDLKLREHAQQMEHKEREHHAKLAQMNLGAMQSQQAHEHKLEQMKSAGGE